MRAGGPRRQEREPARPGPLEVAQRTIRPRMGTQGVVPDQIRGADLPVAGVTDPLLGVVRRRLVAVAVDPEGPVAAETALRGGMIPLVGQAATARQGLRVLRPRRHLVGTPVLSASPKLPGEGP